MLNPAWLITGATIDGDDRLVVRHGRFVRSVVFRAHAQAVEDQAALAVVDVGLVFHAHQRQFLDQLAAALGIPAAVGALAVVVRIRRRG